MSYWYDCHYMHFFPINSKLNTSIFWRFTYSKSYYNFTFLLPHPPPPLFPACYRRLQSPLVSITWATFLLFPFNFVVCVLIFFCWLVFCIIDIVVITVRYFCLGFLIFTGFIYHMVDLYPDPINCALPWKSVKSIRLISVYF